jgi:hypothetical protein
VHHINPSGPTPGKHNLKQQQSIASSFSKTDSVLANNPQGQLKALGKKSGNQFSRPILQYYKAKTLYGKLT